MTDCRRIMNKEQFLEEMVEVLQTEDEITMDTVLEDLEEWDSLSIMSTMAFLDKNFGVKTNMADYKNMTTIGDIARKAGL